MSSPLRMNRAHVVTLSRAARADGEVGHKGKNFRAHPRAVSVSGPSGPSTVISSHIASPARTRIAAWQPFDQGGLATPLYRCVRRHKAPRWYEALHTSR